MGGLLVIVVASFLFFLLGLIPCYGARRKLKLLELENKRLEICVEIKELVSEDSEIRNADVYPMIKYIVDTTPQLPLFSVIHLIFSKKNRKNLNDFTKKFQVKIEKLPKLYEKLDTLNKVDLQILMTKKPLASTVYLILLCWIVMFSNDLNVLESKESVSELILQKSMSRIIT